LTSAITWAFGNSIFLYDPVRNKMLVVKSSSWVPFTDIALSYPPDSTTVKGYKLHSSCLILNIMTSDTVGKLYEVWSAFIQ